MKKKQGRKTSERPKSSSRFYYIKSTTTFGQKQRKKGKSKNAEFNQEKNSKFKNGGLQCS